MRLSAVSFLTPKDLTNLLWSLVAAVVHAIVGRKFRRALPFIHASRALVLHAVAGTELRRSLAAPRRFAASGLCV